MDSDSSPEMPSHCVSMTARVAIIISSFDFVSQTRYYRTKLWTKTPAKARTHLRGAGRAAALSNMDDLHEVFPCLRPIQALDLSTPAQQPHGTTASDGPRSNPQPSCFESTTSD